MKLKLLFVVLAFGGLSISSRADFADEGWGDLGYSKSEAEVEAIPESVDPSSVEPSPEAIAANTQSADEVMEQGESNSLQTSTVTSEDLPRQVDSSQVVDNEALARAQSEAEAAERANNSKKSKPSSTASNSSGTGRSFGKINTVRNTHGVMTEEDSGVQFFVAPFGGMTSITGNTTVDSNPRYALGAQAGLLLTSNLLLGVSFTYSEQNLSGLRSNVTNGMVGPTPDVFAYKSNSIEAGGKLFFLGRESRVRPFFGGGFGWGKSYLNYTAANLQALGYSPSYVNDFSISQFGAYGELGAEVAITRAVVVMAGFKLRGILSTTSSAEDAGELAALDPTKVAVGNSLSRSASYSIGAGLGIYF